MEIVVDNTPSEAEARAWLNGHKDATGFSWTAIGELANVPPSTLSKFSSATYTGDNLRIAANILAYRDRLSAQAELAVDAPMIPAWYDTPSAKRITSMLRWAQGSGDAGRMVLIVTGPGIGKTKAARRYASADPNVWMATMAPSTAGVATMAIEVGAALGLGEIKGSPQQLSRQIKARVQGRSGLIIIDEAQELTEKALNELRGWHDATGVGVALLGNDRVVGQLDSRKAALAQVSSRISRSLVQMQPIVGDIEALLEAWGITDEAQRTFLAKLSALPGALREVTHTLEIALMTAFGGEQRLTLAHLRDAARKRNAKVAGL